MAVKKVATKDKAEKATKTSKAVKAVKVEEPVKVDKCECGCDCKCNSNEWLLKSMFYTLISILVFVAITAICMIILTVDYHNNGKNRNNSISTYSTEEKNNENNAQDYDVSMFQEITVDDLVNLYNGEEKSLIYIGRPTCGYCVAFLPSLQQAQKDFGYQTYYYDIDKVTDEAYATITGLNDFMANNFGYTPMVIVVQNGQILSADGSGEGWVGYAEYDAFKAYLQGLGY